MTTVTQLEAPERKVSKGRYEISYCEAGSGAPFVLLHGSGPGVSGMSNFARNLPVFAEHFRTLVIDMPGFGASPEVDYTRPYPEHAAESVVSFLDDLGIEKAHLLGNSMGGWVALETALLAPERVDRMVMMGPGGLFAPAFSPPNSEGGARLQEFMAAPSREAMIAWVKTMVSDFSIVTDALIDERLANASAPGAIEQARRIFGSLANEPSHPPMFAITDKIPHRTLVTWGRDDRMLPLDGAFVGVRRMPNAELHVFSRCGHWAQVERKADFERLAIDFLSAL